MKLWSVSFLAAWFGSKSQRSLHLEICSKTKMSNLSPDSDLEIGSETVNSSQSSMSSSGSCDRCSSFSRLSFDAAAASTAALDVPSLVVHRPHRSSDDGWAAIRSRAGGGFLGARDFKLIRRIGSGDIGTVYLCRLRDGPRGVYAMKVVDKQAVAKKKKLERAETEKRILKMLDHPFLPTLYADFDASPNYSCVVMEYCSGGDLHSLRHRQHNLRFSVASARFYAAEVLLAIEYLHMLGVVYRDLKPENVLIRSDGHIMLSDFDLSLESTASPSLEPVGPTGDPSCLPHSLFRHRKPPGGTGACRFVAEPVRARSFSLVGTHEYVAPEVAAGGAHGSAVDWWAYGVFLYELLCGRTPFAGPTNESTLRNIVGQPLSFPPASGGGGGGDSAARDLIARLLEKDPARRLGSRGGAADVRAHPFFKGVNLALARTVKPPYVPGMNRAASYPAARRPARFDHF